MTSNQPVYSSNPYQSAILLVSAVAITLALFFVDEGYYNFQWMTQLGNWIPFMVYVMAIFAGQMIVAKTILRKRTGVGGTLLSVFGGTVLGMLVVVFGIFTNW